MLYRYDPSIVLAALVALAILAACGQQDDPSAARLQPQKRTLQAPSVPLSPGADIDPAILEQPQTPTTSSTTASATTVSDLGADRPAEKVRLPRVPRASTAGFSFGHGRQGWITRLPTGAHLPSVAYGDGRVFASGGFDTYAFYAMDASSGRLVWNRQDLADNGPTAAVYMDQDVVFNTESCTLFVLDARTGRTRWKRWLGDPTLAQTAVQHGLIYASYPVDGAQRLAAMTLKSGRQVWSRGVDSELLSAPVVAGGGVYVATIRGTVYRFDAKNGRRSWARRGVRATSAPLIRKQQLFISRATRRRGKVHEAQVVLDARTGKTLTTLRTSRARYLGDVPRTLNSWPKVWAFEGSRPLLAFGRFVDTMGGAVSASNPLSGKVLWQRRDAKASARRTLTLPVLAGTQVIAASRKGTVYALDIDTGMTVWAYDLGRQVASAPVVARGWIYLSSSDGSVIALNVGSPGLDGWHMWGGGPGHNG